MNNENDLIYQLQEEIKQHRDSSLIQFISEVLIKLDVTIEERHIGGLQEEHHQLGVITRSKLVAKQNNKNIHEKYL